MSPAFPAGRPGLIRYFKVAIGAILLVGLGWFLRAHESTIQSNIKGRDSTLYWATAKLLLHRGNPYSIPEVQALEWSEHYGTAKKPKMYRPPPWSLWMILPLGFSNAYWAWIAWTGIALAALVASVRLSWRIYGDAPCPPTIVLVAAYLFAPVVACLVIAQMGTVLLLAVLLFFYWAEKKPLWAGVVLLVPMAKPQFFAPLGLVIVLWCIARKQWRVLAGATLAFVGANLIALTFDPHIFAHYREMLALDQMQNEFMPNVSGVMRAFFFRQHYQVQFVPTLLGMCWAAWYFSKRREDWDWGRDGVWLLVVGALVAPYSWLTDEAVLLPAVIQGIVWLRRNSLGPGSQFVLLTFAVFDLLLLLIIKAKVDPFTGIYFWSSLLWFAWYSFASRWTDTVKPANH